MIFKLKNPSQTIYPQKNASNGEIWWQNCVIYQIYPRSFQDSDGDGVGDLQGIIDRLDYLQELGVDALWLSPVFPSPMADFGYDVSDYCNIDPLFGSLESFDSLLAAAHERGLKLILDFVANHTSNEHPWFIESRKSRHNPKRDWYIWRDAKEDGAPPNNWPSFFGGSAWSWDEETSQYYLHLFSNKQPDLNWRNPLVIEEMNKTLRFWLDRGVDGFRMDAVTLLIKHAQFPDMPMTEGLFGAELLEKHIYVHNQPEVHDLMRDFRQLFDGYEGNRVIIGETGELDPRKLVGFYGRNFDGIHLPFNFIPMHMSWNAAEMSQAISDYYAALPVQATPNFVFGNHDISRLAARYGPANHRAVATLLLTLGGVSTLYYGDELGMVDGIIPPEKMLDPMGKDADGNEQGRDRARTPMQWSAEPNGGFTAEHSEPWLPLADNYETLNVANQNNNPKSTLNYYRKLIELRQQSAALQNGSFAIVDGTPDDVLAYIRQYDDRRLLIVINFADQVFLMDLSQLTARASLQLSSEFTVVASLDVERIRLRPHESLILQME